MSRQEIVDTLRGLPDQIEALVRGLDVLEIGTGLGVSTEWMARTAHSVVTVDIDPWVWKHVFPYLSREGMMLLESIN